MLFVLFSVALLTLSLAQSTNDGKIKRRGVGDAVTQLQAWETTVGKQEGVGMGGNEKRWGCRVLKTGIRLVMSSFMPRSYALFRAELRLNEEFHLRKDKITCAFLERSLCAMKNTLEDGEMGTGKFSHEEITEIKVDSSWRWPC